MMKRDVHEEKTLEQSLVQFLMTTSHDMRTPLNGISLAAQLLTDLESVRRDAESVDLVSARRRRRRGGGGVCSCCA